MPFGRRVRIFFMDHFCSCTHISEANEFLRIERSTAGKQLLQVRDGHNRISTLALGKKLAEGATSRIRSGFKVNDNFSQQLAFKIAKKDKGELLLDEYKLMRTLSHRNIIRVLGFRYAIFDNSGIVIMEKAKGDLCMYVRKVKGNISRHWRRRWKVELICAVDYLHDQDIVHGDIKCENILLDSHFIIKLTDFGSADKKENVTTVRCNQEYLPPELVFRGSRSIPNDYDPFLIDVWGIGVVLFVILTKRLPFGEERPTMEFTKNQNKSVQNLLTKQEMKMAGGSYLLLLDKLLDICPVRRISLNTVKSCNFFDRCTFN